MLRAVSGPWRRNETVRRRWAQFLHETASPRPGNAGVSGGSVAVGNGVLTVDGAMADTSATYAPGRSLEFVATFASDPWQHVGFSINMQEPWAIFSTFTGGALYARTAVGVTHIDTQIPGSWLGAAHRFRIDWTSSGAVYWIDGTQVASHSIAMTANMRPVVSDATVGGGVLTVDWMWMTPPYVASGTFLSRVLDAGGGLY